MADIEDALEQCQSVLEQLLQSAPERQIASPVLRDFKLSLDGLRLTLWAIIQSQEESYLERKGAGMNLAGKLVEFRIKRLVQMLGDLQLDIQDGRLTSAGVEVGLLSKSLRTTLEGVSHLAN